MKREDRVYLQHALDAIAKIHQYLRDVDRSRFLAESLIQDGVIRQLEILGEAVRRLSPRLREDHNQVPWKDVAGMRDKLIHGYFGVDLEQAWLTAVEDVPSLEKEVSAILGEPPGS